MDPLLEFSIRCRILPAQPHIYVSSGKQADELITETDPDSIASRKRALEKAKFNIIPVHKLAPEHHDTLVREHRESSYQSLMERGRQPIFINNLMQDHLIRMAATDGLEQACADKGITEKYEDEKGRPITKLEWLLDQLPEIQNNSYQHYALIAKALMESEEADIFLKAVQREIDQQCHDISRSYFHDGDKIHREREEAFRRCFVIDPSTGAIYCDPTEYPHLVEEVTKENSEDYGIRISELREKLQHEAELLDHVISQDAPSTVSLKRALRDHKGVRIGDNPFSPPLTEDQAKDAIYTALDKVKGPPLVLRLMAIALADENLTISVSTNEKHIENIAGKSVDERRSTYTMGRSVERVLQLPKNPDTWTLVEELMHHAMRVIYENDCKPYKNDTDQRKKLYIGAIMEDFRRNGVANAKQDFELSTYYKLNDTSCEVIAKALAMMATGDWDKIKDNYPVIERHIDYMLTRDVDTYEQKGTVEAYGPQMAKAATISSGARASERPHPLH